MGKSWTAWIISNGTIRCLTYSPMKETRWTLAAKESGEWFKCFHEAAERCMKRWFVKEKAKVAKRRAFEVQNAHQLEAPLGPTPRWGKKRNRVEGGAATAARPVMKLKAPAATWHWPSV